MFKNKEDVTRMIKSLCEQFKKYNHIDPRYYQTLDVKRGLRNMDGTGVLAGLTVIGNVHGYIMAEGERVPIHGRLSYRGYSINDLVSACEAEDRFGFEETIYLLLFGHLPTKDELSEFNQLLLAYRSLPNFFIEDMILKMPSRDIMNSLARSVLALYSYDGNADDTSLENLMTQCIKLIACFPAIITSAYQSKRRYFDHESMYMHFPAENLSTAENILYSIRPDKKYTDAEAKLLDICMILHAEHGGGNNSAFTSRVLASSGTDIYSCVAGAIGSLKGPKHGGANQKVVEMMECVKKGVSDWKDDDEIAAFIKKIINKEEYDRSGLVYGMGHAIYTKSDPRAVLLKKNALKLAKEKGMLDEFLLLNAVERLTPQVFAKEKNSNKVICANVDMYSGFVYKMLGIPSELFTPLFATSRIVGWCAHIIEEFTTGGKIMRPAYKHVAKHYPYIPLYEREFVTK
jgi:citrate synthase